MLPTRASSSRRIENDQPLKKNRNATFSSRGAYLRDGKSSSAISIEKNTTQDSTDAVFSRTLEDTAYQLDHLKQLPDEILLQIAGDVRDTQGLSKLSRVNKHINAIANESMATKLVVHENSAKQAIIWLSKHSELIHCVKAVEVIGPRRVTHTHSLGTRAHFETEVEEVLIKAMLANRANTMLWGQIKLNYEWSRPLDTYVALIALLCPNVKAMSLPLGIQTPFAGMYNFLPIPSAPLTSPSRNRYFKPATPFHPGARSIYHDRLESLTLTQCRGWAGPVQDEMIWSAMQSGMRPIGRVPITLAGFMRLRHLDVPMDILGLASNVLLHLPGENTNIKWMKIKARADASSTTFPLLLPVKTLPLTLETLQLRGCTSRTFLFLELIARVPAHKSRFKRIELYVQTTNAREFIHLCRQANEEHTGYRATLVELADRGIDVKFFLGAEEKIVDMEKELGAMSRLDERRIGVMASTGRQFSEVSSAAMDREGHSGSPIEHRLFMRHAASYFDLLNSEAFAAKRWTQVALFSGEKLFRRGPGNYDSVFADKPPADAHPLPKRRSADIFNFAKIKFTFEKAMPLATGREPVEVLTRSIWGLSMHELGRAATLNVIQTEQNLPNSAQASKTPAKLSALTSHTRRLLSPKPEDGRLPSRIDAKKADTMREQSGTEITHFHVEDWHDVEWKQCLQQRVVRKTQKGRAKHTSRLAL